MKNKKEMNKHGVDLDKVSDDLVQVHYDRLTVAYVGGGNHDEDFACVYGTRGSMTIPSHFSSTLTNTLSSPAAVAGTGASAIASDNSNKERGLSSSISGDESGHGSRWFSRSNSNNNHHSNTVRDTTRSREDGDDDNDAMDEEGTIYDDEEGDDYIERGMMRSRNLKGKSPLNLFYYEVRIVNRGENGEIAIGMKLLNKNVDETHILPPSSSITRQALGKTVSSSFSYCGDTGSTICKSSIGERDENGESQYAIKITQIPSSSFPGFSTGDIIGCGLSKKEVFYTRNGENIGQAFKIETSLSDEELARYLVPAVSMHSPGEIVQFIFFDSEPSIATEDKSGDDIEMTDGSEEKESNTDNKYGMFSYDISSLMRDEWMKQRVKEHSVPVPTSLMNLLIRDYLAFNGYSNALSEFDRVQQHHTQDIFPLRLDILVQIPSCHIPSTHDQTYLLSNPQTAHVYYRKCIRESILNGNPMEALRICKEHFADEISRSPQKFTQLIVVKLKCQNFIEILSSDVPQDDLKTQAAIDFSRSELSEYLDIEEHQPMLSTTMGLLAYSDLSHAVAQSNDILVLSPNGKAIPNRPKLADDVNRSMLQLILGSQIEQSPRQNTWMYERPKEGEEGEIEGSELEASCILEQMEMTLRE